MSPVEIVRDEPGPEKKLRPVPEPGASSSTYVKWENPPAAPESARTRLHRVTAELQRRPGEWALIAAKSHTFMPWWGALADHADFEVTFRWPKGSEDRRLFAPRDVYARYIARAPRE